MIQDSERRNTPFEDERLRRWRLILGGDAQSDRVIGEFWRPGYRAVSLQ